MIGYEGTSAVRLARLTDDYWAAAEDDQWGDKLQIFLAHTVAAQAGH